MKYTLLKNGKIISGKKIIEGDLLIGNSRILAIEKTIMHHSFEAEVIDVKGKYVLPGLIHYNCPFLASGEEQTSTSTSIYQALSHGATFILDTLVFNQKNNCMEQLLQTREGCKPIISDFAFHMGLQSSPDISDYDMDYCFLHEGIPSFYLPANFRKLFSPARIEQILHGHFRHHTIFICDTRPLKSESNHINDYLNELVNVLDVFTETGATVLLLDIATQKELQVLEPFLKPENSIYAALRIDEKQENSTQSLDINKLMPINKNPHVMLLPPDLEKQTTRNTSYIEHGRNISFIENMYLLLGKHGECLLPSLCDLYATRPARLLGVYPRKGLIKAGSDADLIIWSPTSARQKSTETEGTANIALLRRDIRKLIVGGVVVDRKDTLIQEKMTGRFVYRGSPVR